MNRRQFIRDLSLGLIGVTPFSHRVSGSNTSPLPLTQTQRGTPVGRTRSLGNTSSVAKKFVFLETFRDGKSGNWTPTHPNDWEVVREKNRFVYALKHPDKNLQNALGTNRLSFLKDYLFTSFTLTCDLSPHKGKSVVIVFNYQDDKHFYYIHLSANKKVKRKEFHPDGIFVVNNASKVRINVDAASSVLPDTDYHQIKLIRNASTGLIEVFRDDMEMPALKATDTTFPWGKIGLGSFNEYGKFSNVKIVGDLKSS